MHMCESVYLNTAEPMISRRSWSYINTYHRLEVLLQADVPRLLQRHQTITEGLFAPPQDVIRDQVETFEGVPQKILLHSMLLTQDIQHYYYKALQG